MNDKRIFDLAADTFDGWVDSETGLRVLKIAVRGQDISPRVDVDGCWRTWDHQFAPFLEGGRKLLVRGYPLRPNIDGCENGVNRPIHLIDLTTGEVTCPFPKGYHCWEVRDATNLALLQSHSEGDADYLLWDLTAAAPLSKAEMPGWQPAWGSFLSDSRRAIVIYSRGEPLSGHCRSRLLLLEPDGSCTQIHEVDGHYCNHLQGCPTNPDLFSYQRWPSPLSAAGTDEVMHIRSVDGSFEQRLPLVEGTVRPGPVPGGQRDHYLWMPDGKRVASYFLPNDESSACYYEWEWWLSIMDWRTGADLSLPYPPGRWGGHFQITPDGRHLIATGGREFSRLFVVEIDRLVDGWNERVLAAYPPFDSSAKRINSTLNRHPHLLPDASGVVLTGGYPGPQQGIYAVEWPEDLAACGDGGTGGGTGDAATY